MMVVMSIVIYSCQGTVNRDELKITLDMPEITDFIKVLHDL